MGFRQVVQEGLGHIDRQSKALIEMINLHIFREDTTVFSLAVELITVSKFQEMEKQLPRFD